MKAARFSILLLMLAVGGGVSACSDDSSGGDDTPAPKPGALAGTFTPAGTVTAVTATDSLGTAKTVTLPAGQNSYFLGQLPARRYTITYTPATGYETPAPQSIRVIANDTVPVPVFSVRQVVVVGVRTGQLINKSWKLVNATATAFGNLISVYNIPETTPGALQACVKDNLYRFSTNGTVEVDESTLKCSPNDPQTDTGSWVLTNDEKDISITAKGQTYAGQLRTLTDSTFTIYDPAYPVPNFGSLPVELSFKKQ